MHSAQRPKRWMVILAFGLVYLFWGSTYLGIDIAVQTIPPALMCGVRFSIAGVVMLAVCRYRQKDFLFSTTDRPGRGCWFAFADGWQSDAFLRRTGGLDGPGR